MWTSLATAFCLLLGFFLQAKAGDLHKAAKSGDVEAIKVILAEGVDVNESDFITGTAFHLAVSGGHLEAVDVLIANGANIDKILS